MPSHCHCARGESHLTRNTSTRVPRAPEAAQPDNAARQKKSARGTGASKTIGRKGQALRLRSTAKAPNKPNASSAIEPGAGTGVPPPVVNSKEPEPVWYLKPIGLTSTELPHSPPRIMVKVSLEPPLIPPLPPPEQFGPPKAQTSIEVREGIDARLAFTKPPSLLSLKNTSEAFGLIPNPNEVNRLLANAEVLLSVTFTVSSRELKPLNVMTPVPVNGPAALPKDQLKLYGLFDPELMITAWDGTLANAVMATATDNTNLQTQFMFTLLSPIAWWARYALFKELQIHL